MTRLSKRERIRRVLAEIPDDVGRLPADLGDEQDNRPGVGPPTGAPPAGVRAFPEKWSETE